MLAVLARVRPSDSHRRPYDESAAAPTSVTSLEPRASVVTSGERRGRGRGRSSYPPRLSTLPFTTTALTVSTLREFDCPPRSHDDPLSSATYPPLLDCPSFSRQLPSSVAIAILDCTLCSTRARHGPSAAPVLPSPLVSAAEQGEWGALAVFGYDGRRRRRRRRLRHNGRARSVDIGKARDQLAVSMRRCLRLSRTPRQGSRSLREAAIGCTSGAGRTPTIKEGWRRTLARRRLALLYPHGRTKRKDT